MTSTDGLVLKATTMLGAEGREAEGRRPQDECYVEGEGVEKKEELGGSGSGNRKARFSQCRCDFLSNSNRRPCPPLA